ncbi:hypothetical protein RRG08_042997 [Elysia crispata]|uniref:Uncharacterized protein n=1 Tax=Elysia crispata TaxID=231223 RepID=A0AAE0XYQ2_9GAST|nr:hypothetical protein RRG08_042997 [Elysia crispata]
MVYKHHLSRTARRQRSGVASNMGQAGSPTCRSKIRSKAGSERYCVSPHSRLLGSRLHTYCWPLRLRIIARSLGAHCHLHANLLRYLMNIDERFREDRTIALPSSSLSSSRSLYSALRAIL